MLCWVLINCRQTFGQWTVQMVRVAQINQQSRHKYEFHMRKSIYSSMSVTCQFVDLRDGRVATGCTKNHILRSTLLIYVNKKICEHPTRTYRNKHLTLAFVFASALVIHKFRWLDGDCHHLCISIHIYVSHALGHRFLLYLLTLCWKSRFLLFCKWLHHISLLFATVSHTFFSTSTFLFIWYKCYSLYSISLTHHHFMLTTRMPC